MGWAVDGVDDGCSLGTTLPSVADEVGWAVDGCITPADDGCSLGTTLSSVTDGVGWTVDGCVTDSDGEDDGS